MDLAAALALFGNIGMTEMLLILIVAVLIFGKDLPQAASKVYLQARKLRNAVDDLRRESGIDQEMRNIERTVREAEWEARRGMSPGGSEARKLTPPPPESQVPRPAAGSSAANAGASEASAAQPPDASASPTGDAAS